MGVSQPTRAGCQSWSVRALYRLNTEGRWGGPATPAMTSLRRLMAAARAKIASSRPRSARTLQGTVGGSESEDVADGGGRRVCLIDVPALSDPGRVVTAPTRKPLSSQ